MKNKYNVSEVKPLALTGSFSMYTCFNDDG